MIATTGCSLAMKNCIPVERQKVFTCLQIFNEKTITALMTHPELKGAEDTAKFISLILEFWNIVNVHNAGLD